MIFLPSESSFAMFYEGMMVGSYLRISGLHLGVDNFSKFQPSLTSNSSILDTVRPLFRFQIHLSYLFSFYTQIRNFDSNHIVIYQWPPGYASTVFRKTTNVKCEKPVTCHFPHPSEARGRASKEIKR